VTLLFNEIPLLGAVRHAQSRALPLKHPRCHSFDGAHPSRTGLVGTTTRRNGPG